MSEDGGSRMSRCECNEYQACDVCINRNRPRIARGCPFDETLPPVVGVIERAQTTPPPRTQGAIARECDALRDMLLTKNAAYGDSALDPVRVFSSANATEQIRVRIDDKLSRLKRGTDLPDESRRDTIRDLAGYLILLLVAEGAR